MKIISLVPSITELLHALGLENEVVGITKFCVHPQKWFRNKTRIGGTKNIHFEKIKELQPELIIANKEENVKDQVEELMLHYNVHITDVNNYEEALEMILAIGKLVNKEEAAEKLYTNISTAFASLPPVTKKKRAAYFIWKDPWMTVGGDTFIDSMLQKAGFQNIFSDQIRYPVIDLELLNQQAPEYILLSSEPYPFKENHANQMQQQFPLSKIVLADGEMFSWYGSRMLQAANYFKEISVAYT